MQRITLVERTGIRRVTVRIGTAFIADADAATVETFGMAALNAQRQALTDMSVTRNVEMINGSRRIAIVRRTAMDDEVFNDPFQ